MDDYHEEEYYRLILEAQEIPLNSIITKIKGHKEYTLRDRIRIYDPNNPKKEVKALDGSRFLVNDNGDINVVSKTTELVWLATEYQLKHFLMERRVID